MQSVKTGIERLEYYWAAIRVTPDNVKELMDIRGHGLDSRTNNLVLVCPASIVKQDTVCIHTNTLMFMHDNGYYKFESVEEFRAMWLINNYEAMAEYVMPYVSHSPI